MSEFWKRPIWLLLGVLTAVSAYCIVININCAQVLQLAAQFLSQPLLHKLAAAFLAGALGSIAYLSAVYFHMVSNTEEQRIAVLRPFRRNRYTEELCKRRLAIYCSIGGCIAVIFQVDVPTFVPVQSLILGATWPAVISQFLSGKLIARDNANLQDTKSEDSERPVRRENYDFSSYYQYDEEA